MGSRVLLRNQGLSLRAGQVRVFLASINRQPREGLSRPLPGAAPPGPLVRYKVHQRAALRRCFAAAAVAPLRAAQRCAASTMAALTRMEQEAAFAKQLHDNARAAGNVAVRAISARFLSISPKLFSHTTHNFRARAPFVLVGVARSY